MLLFLMACTTGHVVEDVIQEEFLIAEQNLMALASSYTLPEGELVDSFLAEFGNKFALKVYSTRLLFFEDEVVWYSVTVDDRINLERVDGPIMNWNFKIKVGDVSDVVDSVSNVEGVGGVLGLAMDIGTEPISKRLDLVGWISENLE